jgi:hypothetical protein
LDHWKENCDAIKINLWEMGHGDRMWMELTDDLPVKDLFLTVFDLRDPLLNIR